MRFMVLEEISYLRMPKSRIMWNWCLRILVRLSFFLLQESVAVSLQVVKIVPKWHET